MPKPEIRFNASDVLGALALEANRVVMSAEHFSAGASFPDADLLQAVIERMLELNAVLLDHKQAMIALEGDRTSRDTVN